MASQQHKTAPVEDAEPLADGAAAGAGAGVLSTNAVGEPEQPCTPKVSASADISGQQRRRRAQSEFFTSSDAVPTFTICTSVRCCDSLYHPYPRTTPSRRLSSQGCLAGTGTAASAEPVLTRARTGGGVGTASAAGCIGFCGWCKSRDWHWQGRGQVCGASRTGVGHGRIARRRQ